MSLLEAGTNFGEMKESRHCSTDLSLSGQLCHDLTIVTMSAGQADAASEAAGRSHLADHFQRELHRHSLRQDVAFSVLCLVLPHSAVSALAGGLPFPKAPHLL